ncbi:MAG: AAA family ATPase [Deferribacterales bacterium]
MYCEYFGFTEEPFKITPDPDYFYLSSVHETALELLKYGIEDRKGFLTLVGDVGTGKSTLIRFLLRDLKNTASSFILNPFLSSEELLYTITKDFGIDTSLCLNKGDLYNVLSDFLIENYKSGRNALIVVDEAQNLTFESIEMIRQISNIELENEKLVQILLVGQTELEKLLLKDELRQLNQRIAVRGKLNNFCYEDTENYIIHRISVAAKIRKYIFDSSAIKEIHRLTKGNPREINQICDKALLIAYAEKSKKVSKKMIERAAKEYYLENAKGINFRWSYIIILILILFMVGFLGINYLNKKDVGELKKVSYDNLTKSDLLATDNEVNIVDKVDGVEKVDNTTVDLRDNGTKANISANDEDIKLKDKSTEPGCIEMIKNVNMRVKPNMKSYVIKVVKKGEKLYIIDYSNDLQWLDVRYNGTTGYVYNSEKLFKKVECVKNE